MSTLIFIDTNIYLDFYRGGDVSLSILQHFDANHDRIITTSEVEMEYKNNRQRVILDSLSNLKPLNAGSLIIPAFLKESKRNKTFTQSHKALTNQIGLLRNRTAKLLESPTRNDPVYRVLQRLFKARSTCHLTRADKIKRMIRREARQRFMLGYPPRKRDELSMVDAINWEWIIYCAKQCTDDIVIVSRDSDYGCHY
jgi:predicted nucleic acid-binding protein